MKRYLHELKSNRLLQYFKIICIIGGEKMPDKLLELKNDLVFQKLFGKPKNSQITAHFLSLILNRKIYNIDLDANKRMLGNRKDSKTGKLDIRAKFNNGEDCNIELQVIPYEYMANRMLEYWAEMYDYKISSGQDYSILKPTISILITDYKLKELTYINKYHTIWNLREAHNKDKILTNNLELHILEIPKINNDEIPKDELVQWLKFIENPENKEVEKFMEENRFLKQAREELAYLSGEPDFQQEVKDRARFLRDVYLMKQAALKGGREEGRAEGRAEGLTAGEKKKQIEIAKKLKTKNMSIEEIIEITELSKEEIENL